MNDIPLTKRLRKTWSEAFGEDVFHEDKRVGMFAEDFAYFTIDPYIPSTYFAAYHIYMATMDADWSRISLTIPKRPTND